MIKEVKRLKLHDYVVGSAPHRLVQLLLTGAIERIVYSKGQIARGNMPEKELHINKAAAIVNELYGILDFDEGGELAHKLGHVYDYINCRLLLASAENNAMYLDECLLILKEINSAWNELIERHAHRKPVQLRIV